MQKCCLVLGLAMVTTAMDKFPAEKQNGLQNSLFHLPEEARHNNKPSSLHAPFSEAARHAKQSSQLEAGRQDQGHISVRPTEAAREKLNSSFRPAEAVSENHVEGMSGLDRYRSGMGLLKGQCHEIFETSLYKKKEESRTIQINENSWKSCRL